MVNLLHGDCRQLIATLDDNSISACITDPPYEIGYCSSGWDKTGIAFDTEFWKEILRVLKPGGHVIAFSAARKYHRIAIAIEDAGFEIRDQLLWRYARTAVPKTQKLNKQIDAHILYGKSNPITLRQLEQDYGDEEYVVASTNNGMHGQKRTVVRKRYSTMTDQGKKWEGWSTGVASCGEPMVLARKPIAEHSVAGQVLMSQTGVVNLNAMKSSIITCPRPDKHEKSIAGGNPHITIKPINLMGRLIDFVVPPGETVLDPFSGSGTTLVAAEIADVNAIGFEINQDFYQYAIKRLEHYKRNKQYRLFQ